MLLTVPQTYLTFISLFLLCYRQYPKLNYNYMQKNLRTCTMIVASVNWIPSSALTTTLYSEMVSLSKGSLSVSVPVCASSINGVGATFCMLYVMVPMVSGSSAVMVAIRCPGAKSSDTKYAAGIFLNSGGLSFLSRITTSTCKKDKRYLHKSNTRTKQCYFIIKYLTIRFLQNRRGGPVMYYVWGWYKIGHFNTV